MIRVDGYYLYCLGYELHAIQDLVIFPGEGSNLTTSTGCLRKLVPANFALNTFLNDSVFRYPRIANLGHELQQALGAAIDNCQSTISSDQYPSTDVIFRLQEAHRSFEAVLRAELQSENMYLVQQKAAFDTAILVEAGVRAYPNDIHSKAADAVQDLNDAMRCLAFELPTAAAFHMHRATETILGRYWDATSKASKRPKNQTIGSYLHALEAQGDTDQAVLSALKDVKNLHRNPTIHADKSLISSEEAVDLYGAIRASISAMLRLIPEVDENSSSSTK